MPNKLTVNNLETALNDNLNRLARFGANLTEAHSCFIFLPPSFINRSSESDETLLLAGYHSLCNELLPNCVIRKGSGLIGWVAQHAQPIHVSPFEHDSRTLGMYKDDRLLKSLIGVPITLKRDLSTTTCLTGVLICDSKKSFAFSKMQGKLLTELAEEISTTIALLHAHYGAKPTFSWNDFLNQGMQLIEMLGSASVEIIRLKVSNFSEIEAKVGTSQAVDLTQQLHRLIQQSLPPQFPFFTLPNGDCLLILDNMMSTFYENRLRSLAEHISKDIYALQLEVQKQALRSRKVQFTNLAEAISHTRFNTTQNTTGDAVYEYRRA